MFSKRLQVQERMTRQIAEYIHNLLQPYGVAVVVEGLQRLRDGVVVSPKPVADAPGHAAAGSTTGTR
jgi:GTP cyclohydrolase I